MQGDMIGWRLVGSLHGRGRCGPEERASYPPVALVPLIVACLLLSYAACGDKPGPVEPTQNEPTPDNSVASVAVSSPIDTLLAVSRTVQLAAAVLDAQGQAVAGKTVNWSSSDDQVATVSTAGVVTGVAAGSVTITATVDSKSGSLRMSVRAADLEGLLALVDDALVWHLLANANKATAAEVRDALVACTAAVAQGHLVAVARCLREARERGAEATSPDDVVIFAVLGLFLDHAERLLNL